MYMERTAIFMTQMLHSLEHKLKMSFTKGAAQNLVIKKERLKR